MPIASTTIRRPYRVGTNALPHEQLLARVRFGQGQPASTDAREIAIPLTVLDGAADEYWLSTTPVRHGWQDGLGYAENGEVLIGQLHLSEHEIARFGLARAVFHAYARINHLLHGRGYPHWLRMWNYLADILAGEGEAERYRLFNQGRAKALELKQEFERQLPAATAIGTPEGGLLIYFLGAARVAGVRAENPRQVPAIEYPRQYGLKSPNFSRATRVEWADGGDLLVSGTASVVGHETRHAGDLAAQLDETLANLEHLVAHAGQQRGAGCYLPQGFRLYLKNPEQLDSLLPALRAHFGAVPITCLQGTVCRPDLLIEIEGIYSCAP